MYQLSQAYLSMKVCVVLRIYFIGTCKCTGIFIMEKLESLKPFTKSFWFFRWQFIYCDLGWSFISNLIKFATGFFLEFNFRNDSSINSSPFLFYSSLVFLIILMLNLRLKLFALGWCELSFKLTCPIVHVSRSVIKIWDVLSLSLEFIIYSIHSVFAYIIKIRILGLYKLIYKSSILLKTFDTQNMQGSNSSFNF
jgi:hypothetical protein